MNIFLISGNFLDFAFRHKDGRLPGKNVVCSESYGTTSFNNAGEIPCWGIWVHFLLTEKYDFLKSIADSERKFIP